MPFRSLRSKSSGSSKSLWTLQHLRAVPQSGRFQSNCIWYLQEIKLELSLVVDSGVLQLFVFDWRRYWFCVIAFFIMSHLTGSPCGSGESLVCHRDVVERIAGVKVRLHCNNGGFTRRCSMGLKKKHIYGSQKNGSILSIFIIRKVKIGHFKDPTFSKLFTMNTRQYE